MLDKTKILFKSLFLLQKIYMEYSSAETLKQFFTQLQRNANIPFIHFENFDDNQTFNGPNKLKPTYLRNSIL